MQQPPWRNRVQMSSIATAADRFLERQGFDKGPWIAVFFAAGIAFWFVTPGPLYWLFGITIALATLFTGGMRLHHGTSKAVLALVLVAVSSAFLLGISVVWVKSSLAGVEPIARPLSGEFSARILERIEQPAQSRVRLILATREPGTGRAIKIRVNISAEADHPDLTETALIRLGARIMPPSGPLVPGGYDFARTAWFQGLAATGASYGPVEVVEPPHKRPLIANAQRDLSAHVLDKVGGQAGAIASAFASGDRGAISQHNEAIMRDSGLTHLLSISGVHVSAVIAAGYFFALKLLGLFPWLVLRTRLPILSALIGACTGVAYTVVAGMEVPTVRSCIAALLVLCALVMGREPLSMRMLAVAALCVLTIWPEALAGPSFQMSFAAVLAIIALHTSAPIRKFLAARDEMWFTLIGRRAIVLFATGLVIEIALMPIVLFHFHRSGIYGSLANMIAIPLVSVVTMPGIGLGLLFDTVGLGTPFWWVTGASLDGLIKIAEITSSQPGAVKLMPQIGRGTYALFLAGFVLIALLRGRSRWLGLLPVTLAALFMARTPSPDILITGGGEHVAISDAGDELYVLKAQAGSFALDNLTELAGFGGDAGLIQNAPFSRCSSAFCTAVVRSHGGRWTILMSRSDQRVDLEELKSACRQSDIVVASRRLPQSCMPRWFKADSDMLTKTGGIAVYLERQAIETVSEWQGDHGWWRGG